MHQHQLATAEEAMSFIQAGNATFTVVSKKTQARFTYKVTESNDGRVFFVGVLTGPNNETDYQYLGVIRDGLFRRTTKSRISEDAPSAVAFRWTYDQLGRGEMPAALEVWHEGRCGRCGRTLTVPESVATGSGPECSEKLGLARAKSEDFLAQILKKAA